MGRSINEKPITEKKFSAPQDASQYHGDHEEMTPIAAELLDAVENRASGDRDDRSGTKKPTPRGEKHGERRTK